jgi:curved DNA-binding protein CbpA
MLTKRDASPAAAAPDGADTDLSADLQIELLALQARGAALSHYEVLGLDATAAVDKVRAAYLERSRRFHPDAHYRRRVGSFGPLLADMFRRIVEAHAVLSDNESRAAYDEKRRAKMSATERAATDQRSQSRADEERRAEERRKRLFFTKGFAKLGAARRLYEEAEKHAESGERGLAIQALKAARDLDPARKEIAQRLQQLEQEAVKARAQQAIANARTLEAEGELDEALAMWLTACRCDPSSASAHLGGARLALASRDHEQALALASRAVECAPRAAEGRLLVARAYAALGNKAKAKASLQAILEHNPEHKEARALLREI